MTRIIWKVFAASLQLHSKNGDDESDKRHPPLYRDQRNIGNLNLGEID
jgi:hypothetical protein